MEEPMEIEKVKKVRVKKIIDLSEEPKEKSCKGKKKKALDDGDKNEPIFRDIRRQQLFQVLRETLSELENMC